MGFLGWGLFGALFAVSDEVNTRKKIKQEQASSTKRIAEFNHYMDTLKTIQNKNYMALPDRDEILSYTFCIEVTKTSSDQIFIRWDCNIQYNSIAKEFVIYKNYKNQPPQKIATLAVTYSANPCGFIALIAANSSIRLFVSKSISRFIAF